VKSGQEFFYIQFAAFFFLALFLFLYPVLTRQITVGRAFTLWLVVLGAFAFDVAYRLSNTSCTFSQLLTLIEPCTAPFFKGVVVSEGAAIAASVALAASIADAVYRRFNGR